MGLTEASAAGFRDRKPGSGREGAGVLRLAGGE